MRCPARAHAVPARTTTRVGITKTMPMVRARAVPAVGGPKVGMAAIPAATDRAVAAMRVGQVAEAVATGEVETAVEMEAAGTVAAGIQGAEDE